MTVVPQLSFPTSKEKKKYLVTQSWEIPKQFAYTGMYLLTRRAMEMRDLVAFIPF